MRSKTVRLGFKRRRCSSAVEPECGRDTGDEEGCAGRKGDWEREGSTVGLYSFTLPAIVSASSVVSPKLPLPAPSGSLLPRIRALPRRPLARRRLVLSLYTFFVHPYQSRVSLSPPLLRSYLLSVSFSLSPSSSPDFIYPVRVAWTLPAFKYQSVSVAYSAPLMSPLGAL